MFPESLSIAYKQYKSDTHFIAEWLSVTSKVYGYSFESTTARGGPERTGLSKFKAQEVGEPPSIAEPTHEVELPSEVQLLKRAEPTSEPDLTNEVGLKYTAHVTTDITKAHDTKLAMAIQNALDFKNSMDTKDADDPKNVEDQKLPTKGHVIDITEFLLMAEYIVTHKKPIIGVPHSVIATIRRVITARQNFGNQLRELGLDRYLTSERGHQHFVMILGHVLAILEPRVAPRTDRKARSSPTVNGDPIEELNEQAAPTTPLSQVENDSVKGPLKQVTDKTSRKSSHRRRRSSKAPLSDPKFDRDNDDKGYRGANQDPTRIPGGHRLYTCPHRSDSVQT